MCDMVSVIPFLFRSGHLCATPTRQAVKLDLGSSTSMTCFYSNLCLVHVNFHPILVTFVGSSDINVGSIHSILPVLKTQLEFVRSVHKDDA